MRYLFSIDERRGRLLQHLKTRLLLSGSLLIVLLLLHISLNIYSIRLDHVQQVTSQAEIHQQQSWAEQVDILAIAMALLLLLLIFLLLWRTFGQLGRALHDQLTLLEHNVSCLSNGDFGIRVPTLASQELDQLGTCLNTMAETLQQERASVLAQQQREQEQINLALRIQRDELRVLNTALEETNLARSQVLAKLFCARWSMNNRATGVISNASSKMGNTFSA